MSRPIHESSEIERPEERKVRNGVINAEQSEHIFAYVY